MKTFNFKLIFSLPNNSDPNTYVDGLFEAGCDDSIIGTGDVDSIALEFSRESDCAANAVHSAIAGVKKAIPNVELVEVSPDLVSLSDAARVMGFTRQNMQKYHAKKDSGFPRPVHAGATSLWHLLDIVYYLKRQGKMSVPDSLTEVALEALKLNLNNQNNRYRSITG
ncbi:MAG: DNA-binding protein [Mariprofundus sp.]|nr:DNA-binding protein [Mariprofundus sp.]